MARAPSQEQIRILGELARSDESVRQDEILSRMPDWKRYESAGALPSSSARLLEGIHGMSLNEKGSTIVNNPKVAALMLKVFEIQGDLHPIHYVLSMLYDIVRDDTSRYDQLLEALQEENLAQSFLSLLERPKIDAYASDKAAFLLSGLIARAPLNSFMSESKVEHFVHSVAKSRYQLSSAGAVEALRNILKNAQYRKVVWDTRSALRLIGDNLSLSKGSVSAYQAAFCVWLFSMDGSFREQLLREGLVDGLCKLMKEAKAEKIVRVSINALLNLLDNDNCIEAIISYDVAHTITLLEYEKWRDEEMYDKIRELSSALQNKIKQFSNFDRYCRELEKGKLTWSYLHSEKFWHENIMLFEESEFSAVKKVALLLRSSDATTLAVACHDLGEFARLYPTGKQVIHKLNIKEKVMELMSNRDRAVSREALLCTQKFMLDKWQDAAGATEKTQPTPIRVK